MKTVVSVNQVNAELKLDHVKSLRAVKFYTVLTGSSFDKMGICRVLKVYFIFKGGKKDS